MRSLQERIEKSEFVHHLQRRGMDGVAAEVPQEISVLFEEWMCRPVGSVAVAAIIAAATASAGMLR